MERCAVPRWCAQSGGLRARRWACRRRSRAPRARRLGATPRRCPGSEAAARQRARPNPNPDGERTAACPSIAKPQSPKRREKRTAACPSVAKTTAARRASPGSPVRTGVVWRDALMTYAHLEELILRRVLAVDDVGHDLDGDERRARLRGGPRDRGALHVLHGRVAGDEQLIVGLRRRARHSFVLPASHCEHDTTRSADTQKTGRVTDRRAVERVARAHDARLEAERLHERRRRRRVDRADAVLRVPRDRDPPTPPRAR